MASRAADIEYGLAANDADAREWFSAGELEALALPGLPGDKRSINRRAQDEGWARRRSADGAMLVRPRAGRGGGVEFHASLLPPRARLALAQRGITETPPQPEPVAPDAGGWRWYEAQGNRVRAEAERRLAIVAEIELLEQSGMTRTAAIADIYARRAVGKATMWNWLKLIDGVAKGDRLPALAPRHSGGGKQVDIDQDAWKVLVSDYLRPERPTFTSCYDRLEREYAKPRGLKLPHERTLRRKLEREVNPLVVTARREGQEALRKTLPPQQRSVAGLHALELVNIDGHKWDVWVKWPGDKDPCRPVMVAIQDVYSRKFLGWSIGKTESVIETRLALAHMLKRYGIPRGILLDNGRAFASKWITGGATSRFRFTIRDDEPLGIITALGINSHWAQPYRGQSKPIERGFRDFCDRIAKRPEFAGAYTGNRPDAKPENYRSASVPIDRFIEVVEAGIAAHNALEGRRTEMGKGVHSFDQVFEASYAVSPIGKATPEQLRLALLAADDRPTDRKSGAISLFENRYWCPELSQIAGDRVTVRFDPDDLHAPLHVYTRDGAYLCSAPVIEATGFLDADAAKRRSRLERGLRRSVKAMVEAEDLLEGDRIAAVLQKAGASEDLPDPGAIRPVRTRGQTAAALKAAPESPLRPVSKPAEGSILAELAQGRRLRVVK